MAVRKIVQPPSPFLKQVSEPLKPSSVELKPLLRDLIDTLNVQQDPPGVGISAPQIAQNVRVFLARVADIEMSEPIVFINPRFESVSPTLTSLEDAKKRLEGCLSLPGIYGVVLRHEWVEVTYQTVNWGDWEKGNFEVVGVTKKFDGFAARVIQHEYDHLEGIMFTQRVLEQGGTLFEVEIEKGKEVLVELELI